MARSGKTAQEFIQSSFSPIVAVLCSPKVDVVVSKNNVSFTELLQPFAAMDWEGQFREPGGSVCIIKNLKLIIRDVNWKPLQPTEARRQLNNAVLYNYNDKIVSLDLDGRKFDIPQSTPWFDAWREAYLDVQFPSDHEFTKHFLSCIIVATTQDENIIDTFNSLNQQYAQLQNVTPHKLPKWFNAGVLKSYLLLHDASNVTRDKADTMYETLKQSFGAANCFMLTINSKTTTEAFLPTDYWAAFIKRSESNTEMPSSVTNQQSPLEQTPTYVMGASVQPETSDPTNPFNQPENSHPLTTHENEIYDQANSLQTHSFSGSVESVHIPVKTTDISTEVHGAALNVGDIESVKKFMQEYSSKALLPYLEKQISQLSEVVANRKGVSRSLLSATKRWFGTGKGTNTTGNNTVIYTTDCPELQLRRLGDLWFMTGQWQRAFDAYHMAKREFYADSAWLCYAGALEMAGISAFMSGDSNRKMPGYMEESIVTYLNTCRMVQYAVRATLLSTLCLSSQGLHGEAAKQLIRMTSEDSDLRSAMLLEQASLCFLSGPGSKAMCRKYAFHMVLAGHRFSKAGQKKHAYRCYQQAYQVYAGSGWRLATDHVQFGVGRLAGSLRLHAAAVRWLAGPLAPAPRPPLQPAAMQRAFLREYMLHHQQWVDSSDEFKECLPVLPLPIVELSSTAVLCVGPAPLSSPARVPATSIKFQDKMSDSQTSGDDKCWNKMEEMLVQVAQGSVPMIFKPTIDLYTAASDAYPVVYQGEPVQISITLKNPLKISLVLKDVQLLWSFVPCEQTEGSKDVLSNEAVVAAGNVLESSVIYGQKIKSVLLEEDSKKNLIFALTPLNVGEINIQGLAYKLINPGEGGNENTNGITISGKIHLSGETSSDKRIKIKVLPSAPCLQMTFSEINSEIISGEMRNVDVEFRNVGPVDMNNLYIAFSHPDCVHLVANEQTNDTFKVLYDEKYREPPTFSDERAARASARRHLSAMHVSKCADSVPCGGALRARLLLRPRIDARALRLLAYYEPAHASKPVHRLLRHVFRFDVTEAVEISVTPRRSLSTTNNEIIENMNLVVEVKNICREPKAGLTVEVLEAALLSRQWKLTNLVSAKKLHDPLVSNEKLHLILKSKRLFTQLPNGKVECSYLKVAESHPDSVANINSSPYCKFVLDDKESYIEKGDSLNDDTENMYNKTNGLIQSMLVLRWKVKNNSNNTSAIGQHCLWMDCFTKTNVQEEPNTPATSDDFEIRLDLNDSKKKKNDNIVVFQMEHPNQITHNFQENRLCMVPITINVVNCYGVPVEVSIDLSKQLNRSGFNSLGWAGALGEGGNLKVSLERYESRRVQVRGVCARPSTYVVGSGTLSCRPAHAATPILHHVTNTSLLVVRQA